MREPHEGIILAVGNPLLDIIVRVDQNFLKRWKLKSNDTVLCDEQRLPIFEEILGLNPDLVPGGSIQNTAVFFQWILGLPNRFSVLGVVGEDEEGRLLEEKLRLSGVDVSYRKKGERTGKCAVMVNGENRSLCTLLGASRLFRLEDLLANEERIQRAEYFYCSALFLNTSSEVILHLAKKSKEQGKTFMLNLGAPFVLERHKETLISLHPLVDVVFGNKEETLTFAKITGIEYRDIREVAVEMITMGPQMVVVTQAKQPILVSTPDGLSEYDAPDVPQEEVVDTNGAGDAFVGGFLAQFVLGKSVEECVQRGKEAAAEVLRVFGCVPPQTKVSK